jgi:hypothetical protein
MDATTHLDTTTCDRCERPARRLVPAYWGEALCPDCCQLAVAAHDFTGWPPLPDADAAG